jgi:flagellar basal-body rod protein FlgC
MSDLFSSLKISGSGMSVQRMKMNTTAENIANAETTRTPDGKPYRRKQVLVSSNERSVTFSGELGRAKVQLSRTHAGHKSTSARRSSGNLSVSEASARVLADRSNKFKMIHDPSHPDADADGYVAMPDINVVTEMVNMMVAARAFEANVTAANATKEMISEAMDI